MLELDGNATIPKVIVDAVLRAERWLGAMGRNPGMSYSDMAILLASCGDVDAALAKARAADEAREAKEVKAQEKVRAKADIAQAVREDAAAATVEA